MNERLAEQTGDLPSWAQEDGVDSGDIKMGNRSKQNNENDTQDFE